MRDHTPRLPTSPGFWRSPLRGPWLTSVLGLVLLVGITVLFVTGLLSYAAYNPGLSPLNDKTPDKGLLGFYLFAWPTRPHWLYRLTQGVHVTLGVTLVPVLLAKLWSVVPKLFTLPPVRSLAHALERLSLLLLVGGALFEFVTGVLNVQLDYVFPGSFYPLHFYGAWVFFAAFLAHAALKTPAAVRNVRRMRERGKLEELEELGERREEGEAGQELVSSRPDPATVSRRGALWFVGGGSLLLFGTTAGQSLGGPLRRTALLAPHGGADPGSGPNGFQINKTAAYAGVDAKDTDEDAWRLVVVGRTGTVRLSGRELRQLPLHSAALPIACVEGWSTSDQWWRGVRLRDLAELVGHDGDPPDLLVESVQRHGSFRRAALRANQVADPDSLLALQVNGEDLSPDHGYPARVIVPAAPGVLNTKWVARMTFGDLR
ncbi:DMSO/TMAO reductase YedYZ molybdopterin-dependent catalytic subunit [Streptomyces sp. V3I8]|uniref:molybdopterin-dependent oxidoreductase n=1 Tax=Streptomyces sp. V3I8 TaxID=3042279 RepID=UPI002789EA5D|nr:molybdopterin-dependent oxidoreductase [Streptomyces sp. V3I8]MDQ1034147.1 DMSO/TMAO reductase YedYZ molybdopterin-dependent catalytic subunit [Streptomyces sp. V3I8]